MFKMKHMGVAVALILVAAGAMASNFRASDQVYVPAAGHLASASATFISDVWVANMSTDSVDVSVIYTPIGATSSPQYADHAFTLAPSERKEFVDFFPSVLAKTALGGNASTGFGSLIFNACKLGADCVGTQDSNGVSPFFRPITVFSRIYSIPAGQNSPTGQPSNGQDMPGIPWYNFVSSRQATPNSLGEVTIQGLRNNGTPGQTGTYRGNVGLLNASQYSTTTLIVNLYNGAAPTTPLATANVTLGPLGFVQQNLGQMFPTLPAPGPTLTDLFITVSQTNNIPTNDAPTGCATDGCPGFLAYASVLDNATNDATTLEAVYEKALTDISGALDAIYGTAVGTSHPPIRRAVKLNH